MADPKADKKSNIMLKKTEDFRKDFGIQKPDNVIQWYDCSLNGASGTLFISQNFVCFKGGGKLEKIAYINIKSITPGSKIAITMNDGKQYVIGSFPLLTPGHSKECYEFLVYLQANTVTYVDPKVIAEFEQIVKKNSTNPQQATMQRAQYDTDAADMALKSALDAQYIQQQTAQKLREQGDQIRRIGTKIDGIQDSLNRADHLLRGIESARYFAFGRQKKSPQREEALRNKPMPANPNAVPTIEIDVLYKKKDDSVLPAIIVLDESTFKIVNPMNGSLVEKNVMFKYDQIEAIVMRARHEHMDIRFKGTGAVKDRRVRLMSSYLQQLTNILWTRSKKTAKVDFEPLVRRFEWKDDKVLVVTANLALLSYDPETQKQAEHVQDNLDQIHSIVKNMNYTGREMINEVEYQTEELNRQAQQVEMQNQQLARGNQRLDHQIEKY